MLSESCRMSESSPSTVSSTSTPEAAKLASSAAEAIVFFDGVCAFCQKSIDFVMRHDSAGRFQFAPLQGETAAKLLTASDREQLSSLVMLWRGNAYRRSAAAVRVLWVLGGVWRVLGILLWLIPRPLRDGGYRLVAAWRYRIFGKVESCRLPRPGEQARILP